MRGRLIVRILVTLTLAASVTASTLFLLARDLVIPDVATEFGVTFSPRTAYEYGTDARESYTALLDEMEVRLIRLPLYWDEVEPVDDAYSFGEIDWYLDEAAKRNARVTLVVGMKVPRWPECYVPGWVGVDGQVNELREYIETVVVRYKDHPALLRWQVENEIRFPFGECAVPDLTSFDGEVALVRELDDNTPIQVTVSGEQEFWADSVRQADVLGVSMYRFAWNKSLGLIVFPHPSSYYSLHRLALGNSIETAIISELQAEPWFVGALPISTADRYDMFPAERLHDHVRFALATEFSEAYLWGAEWWYALRMAGEPRLWDAAQIYF